MKPAASQMEELINLTNFSKPSFEIVSNVTSQTRKDPKRYQKIINSTNILSVKWRESIINMSQNGVKNFLKLGPGKVLTGMIKRTLKNINCFSINSINDMKNIPNEFK